MSLYGTGRPPQTLLLSPTLFVVVSLTSSVSTAEVPSRPVTSRTSTTEIPNSETLPPQQAGSVEAAAPLPTTAAQPQVPSQTRPPVDESTTPAKSDETFDTGSPQGGTAQPSAPSTTPQSTSAPAAPAITNPVDSAPTALEPPSPLEDDEDAGAGWKSPFGLYFNLGGAATFTTQSTHAWSAGADCPRVSEGPLDWAPDCNAEKPVGAALEGRIGVRFWFVALEGFAIGAIDWSSAKLEGEAPPFPLPSYATDMTIGRVGGGLGGGLRFISPPGAFRIGLGIGGGAMFRHVYSNVSSLDGSSLGYTAPLGRADLTITLADTIKFGVIGWVEKSKTVKISPDLAAAADLASVPIPEGQIDTLQNALGDVTVFEGNQYFIGPYLGLHFGS